MSFSQHFLALGEPFAQAEGREIDAYYTRDPGEQSRRRRTARKPRRGGIVRQLDDGRSTIFSVGIH